MRASDAVGAAPGQVIVPVDDLDAAIAFFADRLGFRLDSIEPADSPRAAVVSGHGMVLRLDRNADGAPPTLRLPASAAGEAAAAGTVAGPGGARIELVEPVDAPIPPLRPSLTISRVSAGDGWGGGRAAMRYRDLVPDRQGGRFVASHIRIDDDGPVPDYVHHHDIRFQLLHCRRGRVRVVYEDQGEPFWLTAGDTVLQPPGIRHRVLESADGLEVIELACPAEHTTYVEHDITLPTAEERPDRDFGGQRFVHHAAADATWHPWGAPGWSSSPAGLAAATGGLVEARRVRTDAASPFTSSGHGGELRFWFVIAGTATLRVGDRTEQLGPDDTVTVPPGVAHQLRAGSNDLELLEVTVPADLP